MGQEGKWIIGIDPAEPTMRERLARAVETAKAEWRKQAHCYVAPEFDPPPDLLADAILAELENPSEAMVEAPPPVAGENPGPEEIFKAMIAAARKG